MLARFWPAAALLIAIASAIVAADRASSPERRTPVIVELFTSEGCSSCPPADQLLEKLDQSQPVPGAEIIALGEHVDYWNHIGWTDPYSAAVFSSRQAAYARRFQLEGSYTPQMVVDGAVEFVGSDSHRAESAISAAAKLEKIPVRLSAGTKTVRIEVGALANSSGGEKADVFLALAQVSGTSNVLHGENQGRRLHHVAIVKSLQRVGSINAKAPFAKDVPLGGNGDLQNVRIIVFVQGPGNGQVWGAAMVRAAHAD